MRLMQRPLLAGELSLTEDFQSMPQSAQLTWNFPQFTVMRTAQMVGMIKTEPVSRNAQPDSSSESMSARDQSHWTERYPMSNARDAIKKDFTGISSTAHMDTLHPTLDIALPHAQKELVMPDILDVLENTSQELTQEPDAQKDTTPRDSCAGRCVIKNSTLELDHSAGTTAQQTPTLAFMELSVPINTPAALSSLIT